MEENKPESKETYMILEANGENYITQAITHDDPIKQELRQIEDSLLEEWLNNDYLLGG